MSTDERDHAAQSRQTSQRDLLRDWPPQGIKWFYSDAYTAIAHGDCRAILPVLAPVDLVLTDPPYGINAARIRNSQVNGWRDYEVNGWDNYPAPKELIDLCVSAGKASVIWGGNYFELPPRMGWLVWDKGQREFSLADCELAWTSENRATRCLDYARGKALQDGKQHPTQKPVAVMAWCMSLFPAAKVILDPFLGSGTTALAAKQLGRKCIGIEIEEKYCEIAANRLQNEPEPLFVLEEPAIEQNELFGKVK